ncbi:MAG: hypothetical protein ACK4TA_24285 [Saprospiraceae bacterium]
MDQQLKKINTFAELQEEKNKLKTEIRYSRQQLMQALDGTRSSAQNLLLRRVVVPAGIAGLAVAGVKVAQSLRHEQHDEEEDFASYTHYNASEPASILDSIQQNLASSSKWYIRLLPVAFQLIRRYMANRQDHHAYQQRHVEDATLYPSESSAPLPAGSH